MGLFLHCTLSPPYGVKSLKTPFISIQFSKCMSSIQRAVDKKLWTTYKMGYRIATTQIHVACGCSAYGFLTPYQILYVVDNICAKTKVTRTKWITFNHHCCYAPNFLRINAGISKSSSSCLDAAGAGFGSSRLIGLVSKLLTGVVGGGEAPWRDSSLRSGFGGGL